MNQKNSQNLLNHVPALILCGGLGTRLRSVVSDKPKGMAEVQGKPFLEIIVQELLHQGFRKIIFCTGYLGDHIEDYFKKKSYLENPTFEFSREEKPLGTGGALKNALKLVKSDHFFVANGDTAHRVDVNKFFDFHIKNNSVLSLALVSRQYSNGVGNVVLAKDNMVSAYSYSEINDDKEAFASAGCYIMSAGIGNFFPKEDKFSLEHDIFPKLSGVALGFLSDGNFLDIGTPERYSSAKEFFA